MPPFFVSSCPVLSCLLFCVVPAHVRANLTLRCHVLSCIRKYTSHGFPWHIMIFCLHLFALAHMSQYQRYTFRLKQPEILLIGFKNVEYAHLIPSGSTWQYLADYVTSLLCSHKEKYSVQAKGTHTAWRAGPGGLSPRCVGRPTPMACLYLHRHAPHHGNIIRIVGYYLS